MGTCYNCNTQVTLQEEQTKCDKCHAVLTYHCNNCKEQFRVENKKTKKKLVECKFCGYFICPHCGVCNYNCDKYQWQDDIMRILAPELTFTTKGNVPRLKKRITNIDTCQMYRGDFNGKEP